MEQIRTDYDDDVFGMVYKEFYAKIGPGYYFFERDDSLLQYHPSETYFQPYDHWIKEEQSLIQTIFTNNFKSVLDIGSGAGRISL